MINDPRDYKFDYAKPMNKAGVKALDTVGRIDFGLTYHDTTAFNHNGTLNRHGGILVETPQTRVQEGTLLYRQLNSKACNTQVGGAHYKKLAIQPLEYSMANSLDAAQSSVVRYITRFRDKDGARDLRKILHYVEYLLETEYPDAQ